MLQAINQQQGILQTLALLAPSEIAFHRIQSNFYCPNCKEPVLIKAGEKVIPHFAHHAKSQCPLKQGGEGEYHERGKFKLYQWLLQQKITAYLEVFIDEIQQRADILIELKGRLIAIEFQCATISNSEFKNRSHGYRSINITPIWILGGNRMKRRGARALSMSSFELLFLHQFHNNYPLTMFFYCPNSNQFSIFQNVMTTGKKKTYGNLYFTKLHQISFYQLFKKNKADSKQLLIDWKSDKVNFRTRTSPHVTKIEKYWRQWLYINHTHPSLLPSIVHLPVPSQFLMNTPPAIWQSKLCIEILSSYIYFDLKICYSLLKNDIKPQTFYPLVHGDNDPIAEYLTLLCQLKVIKVVDTTTTFRVIERPIFHRSVDSAINEDEQVINLLIDYVVPSNYTHD
ncbi:hypothetical protein GH741_11950 [Aquibacillus halophilus]|uniref:Competence protein CoiA n=1 Tax=Aquibacillus halophilus TaxID=930132 RepID=A0A6A8DQ80_9BACI|nr:competence protein CoiA family protein [Aquibacillus halophilus]MRH43392.1 hypothetical protein [Aquibacillus halophilus]